jgi:urea transport system permease protein
VTLFLPDGVVGLWRKLRDRRPPPAPGVAESIAPAPAPAAAPKVTPSSGGAQTTPLAKGASA